MEKKRFISNWALENRRKIIIVIILTLAVFVPILACGKMTLSITQVENRIVTNFSKSYPTIIYEGDGEHIFWIERDDYNNFTIKHKFRDLITNMSETTKDYFHELKAIKNDEFIFLIWENNGSMYYTKGKDNIWDDPVEFTDASFTLWSSTRYFLIDNNETFHRVYTGYFGIYYSNYSTETKLWSPTLIVNETVLGVGYNTHQNPAMAVDDDGQILISWDCSTYSPLPSDTILAYSITNQSVYANTTISSIYARYANNPNIWIGSDGTFNVFWYEGNHAEGRISNRNYDQNQNSWGEIEELFEIENHRDDNEEFTIFQDPENQDRIDIIWERRDGYEFIEYWWAGIRDSKSIGVSSVRNQENLWQLDWCMNDQNKLCFVYVDDWYNFDYSISYSITVGITRSSLFFPFANIFAIIGYAALVLVYKSALVDLRNYLKEIKKNERNVENMASLIIFRPIKSKIKRVKELWEEIEKDNIIEIKSWDESEFFDRKKRYEHNEKSRKKLERHIVAMANTYGGILAFGIDDEKELAPLSANERDKIEKRIRDITKYIQGTVIYQHHPIITNKVKDLGIICFYFPKYTKNPHRTSRGRYYWRNGRNSDDIPARFIIIQFEEE